MTSPSDLIRLRQAVRESRLDITREYSGLIEELDFKRRFTESVKRHPLGWIGGAVSAGLLATIFGVGGRKKSSAPSIGSAAVSSTGVTGVAATTLGRAGWIAGALELGKVLYPVLKPIVMPILTDVLGNVARSGLAKRRHLQ
jgi:hypothetical protein